MSSQPFIPLFRTQGLNLVKTLNVHSWGRFWYSGLGSILMLHRVCYREKQSKLIGNRCQEITPEYLEQILKYLRQHNYAILSLDEVYDVLTGRCPLRHRWVSLTFDDGYKDNLSVAYPILKQYGVPFTIYLTTCFPDRTAILWWYLLDDLISQNEQIRFAWKDRHHAYPCASAEEKEAAFGQLRGLILQHFQLEDDQILQAILVSNGVELHQKTSELCLSWEEVIEISHDPLVTIGAHTLNHLRLGELRPEQAEFEVSESRKRIESRIHKPVEHFSYPFGERADASQREFDLARKCGFKTATTTRLGNIFSRHRDHLLALPRLPILGWAEDLRRLELDLSGFRPWIHHRFHRVVTD